MSHNCTNIHLYDGKFRCMECYKEFVTAEPKEDVMNYQMAAPAIARIQELETENTRLLKMIAAMKSILISVNMITVPVEFESKILEKDVEILDP